MIVFSQKKSSDPIQQALRDKKSAWNKKVSLFIDNVIHLKKLMNGMPSKFFMEKSKITEPVKKEPSEILNFLLKEFNDIISNGNEIIASQLSYSKTRRKKRDKFDLSKQLTASANYNLISENSNVLTRFLSSLKGPRFGSSPEVLKRRTRLSLLEAANDLYKLCSKFQSEIAEFKFLSKDMEGLEEANKTLIKIENDYLQILQSLQVSADKLGQKIPKEDSDYSELFNTIENKISPDWNSHYTYFTDIDSKLANDINKQLEIFNQVKAPQVKKTAADKIIKAYEEILFKLNSARETNATSLSELLKLSTSGLQSSGGYGLSKLHGKTLRSLVRRKTNSSRLLAYEAADDMRKSLDQLMNLLEKDLDITQLYTLLNKDIFNSLMRMKESYNSIISSVDFDYNLMTPEQKSKLDRLVNLRKSRQLAERLSPRPKNIQ